MPRSSESIFESGEPNGPAFPDVSFETERALWLAEFDSVGEEAVRGYVGRNSYSPTGMEIARQWLAQRELLQLREDVQSIKALAQQAQGTASASLKSASEALSLASTATITKKPRPIVIVAMAASLIALCGTVMVLASSRQIAPTTKQASAPVPRQTAIRPLPPAPPPQQASTSPPESAPTQQTSGAPQIKSPAPTPQGPSLAKSLALIAGGVSGEGTVNFTVQLRDAATGRDRYEQRLYRASNVTADPNRCQVRYHWHAEQEGRAVSDQARTIDLRLARSVRLTSMDAEPGLGSFVRAYPKVHVVHIAGRTNASAHNLYFYNRDMAARVVTSARRAVELCGKRAPKLRSE